MSPDVAALAETLKALPLLQPEQLPALAPEKLAPFPDAKNLLGAMVKKGWLTAFQAQRLLQGKGAELVLGKYVLLDRLGEGGMGEVYKARHSTFGRVVALKQIKGGKFGDPTIMERFQREMVAMAQVQHPHVVQALDADCIGGVHFLVMEYVEGIDLGKLVRQKGPLPVREAAECVRQAALALGELQARGLVHRDVKPSNLLRDEQGTVKLLDMGLARLPRSAQLGAALDQTVTQTGVLFGSLDYISPEQATNSHNVDIRADLYSLGCVFYHLLTGRPPFPGDDPLDKLVKHRLEEPPPLTQVRKDVPPGIAAVVRKLLAKRAADRYQTPAEVAAALDPDAATWHEVPAEALIEPVTVDHPPAAVPGPVPPPLPPRPAARRAPPWWIWAGAGAAAVLLLAVLAAATGRGRDDHAGAEPPPPTAPAGGAGAQAAPTAAKATRPVAPAPKRPKHPGGPAPMDQLSLRGMGNLLQLRELFGGRAEVPAELVAFLPIRQEEATAVAVSPDGAVIAAAGPQGTVALFDAATGRPVHRAETAVGHGPRARVQCLAFTEAGDRPLLASGDDDGKVVVRGLEAPRRDARVLNAQASVYGLAFSPDGDKLATAAFDGKVRLWDVAGGRELRHLDGHRGPVRAVAFREGGKILASGGQDGTIRLWDVDGRGEPQVIQAYPFVRLRALAWGPDGRTLLSLGGLDSSIRQWDYHSGQPMEPLIRLGHPAEVLAVGADHHWLAAAGQDKLTVIRDKTPHTWTLPGPLAGIALAPDGRHVLAGGRAGVFVLRLGR